MTSRTGSRRTFLVGGVAAAAVVGPLAIAAATKETSTPLWKPAAPKPASNEIAGWTKHLGARIKIVGEFGPAVGKVAALQSQNSERSRPLGLRANPFTLFFEVDA